MTGHSKRRLQKSIEQLVHEGSTNLWAGIRAGLKVFEDAGPSENVQGLFILTDGQPNHMCPSQGYVPKMKPMLAGLAAANGSVPTIHTFGFGYDIRSGLLQSIAELGLGSYAFIPDAGMIGTVFIHAVANLYSTFATHLQLEFNGKAECETVFNISTSRNSTIMRLGNLQYGQSRDFVINSDPGTDFTFRYSDLLGNEHQAEVEGPRLDIEFEYHLIRTELCSTLAKLFPRLPNGEHRPVQSTKDFNAATQALANITAHLQNSNLSQSTQSILDDLDGEEPFGQISKAVLKSGKGYWAKWGRHYLPSLLHAHARQVCNSFKDPGPLRYSHASPLFIQCRDELDAAFDKLPAPTPSRAYCSKTPIRAISMAMYHNSGSSCFDGESMVRLAADAHIRIADLTAGMKVWTSTGVSTVAAVLKTTPAEDIWLVKVGDLWVTPWHPIHFLRREWWFPLQVATQYKQVRSPVYSVVLDADSSSHDIEVGGQVGVTMGHGILPGAATKDNRAHSFFGDRERVIQCLGELPRDDQGHYLSSGVERDSDAGLVSGFVPFTEPTPVASGSALMESDPRQVSEAMQV